MMLSTTTDNINEILRSVPETRKFYMGCFPCNHIPTPRTYPSALVVNHEPSHKGGSHWVGIYFNNAHELFYFDPLGVKPNECIEHYIKINAFTNIIYNNLPIQPLLSPHCGLYCVIFIYLMCIGKKFPDILSRFMKIEDRDNYVLSFVKHIFYQ